MRPHLQGNWIVSYPKSGRTWLRVILGKLLCDQLRIRDQEVLQLDKLSEAARLERTDFTHDGSDLLAHLPLEMLERDKTAYRNSDILLLTRDLRDLMVSCYFQAVRRICVYRGPISSFIRDPRCGAEKVLTFYAIWHDARHTPRSFTALSYEEMHEDIAAAAIKAARWIGLSPEPNDIKRAITFASFDNMRRMEETGAFGSQRMAPGNRQDPESFKTRRGKVGGYRDYLSEEDIAYLDEVEARLGNPFIEAHASAMRAKHAKENPVR